MGFLVPYVTILDVFYEENKVEQSSLRLSISVAKLHLGCQIYLI